MKPLQEAIEKSRGIHSRIAADVWGKETGEVYCLKCGRAKEVNYAYCLAHGWPECCGETMTVDSPGEVDRAG